MQNLYYPLPCRNRLACRFLAWLAKPLVAIEQLLRAHSWLWCLPTGSCPLEPGRLDPSQFKVRFVAVPTVFSEKDHCNASKK